MSVGNSSDQASFYGNVFPSHQQIRRQPFVRGGLIADADDEFALPPPTKRVKLAETDDTASKPDEKAISIADFYSSVVSGPSQAKSRKRPTSKPAAPTPAPEPKAVPKKIYFCDICNCWDESRQVHCASASHMLAFANHSMPTIRPGYGIPQTNVGYQILKNKMNWKEEKGLGRSEQGRLYPVATAIKMTRTGLGAADTEKARVTHITDPTTAAPLLEKAKQSKKTGQFVPIVDTQTRKTVQQEARHRKRKDIAARRAVRSDADVLNPGIM